jgi:adenine modification enzyme
MKGFIFSDQDSLFGHRDVIGFGEDIFYVKKIPREAANRMIARNHYSGKFVASSRLHLGVFYSGGLRGVLQFGVAMNPASMGSIVKDTGLYEYLELNRMWIDDESPHCAESKAISYSIKLIKKIEPKVKWIQSFADERCGKNGLVYQAANFEYYGEHTSTFWELDGEVFHNSLATRRPELSKKAALIQAGIDRATKQEFRQFRYLFFIDKRCQKKCLLKKQKPPR